MTCCLVRDLLPLYIEGDCETETERFISRHLESCGKCGSLYHMMKEPLDLGSPEMKAPPCYAEEERRFKERYYGKLLIKAAGLFGAVFFIMLILKMLI
ncbi:MULTISPECIES: anti-sigma factor family protein [Bacillus]|uniref:Putative zinc-finger domain-containing protein n=1 Tax=Bacillus velezensis TaxID=492670 RepID=A0A411A5J8_BACVE|nr:MULTISPECIES: zf-HC2 domain-containing protein [Bacillus]APA02532.1 anti-sigma factor [Bacillus velezensis]ASB65187.1 Anti-sigma-YlaC factor YlaD [Bacillus velezensis]AXS60587.1 anti-sigma factor [Bacillus velezensis]MCG1014642.1 zf-HC2 domain-containing protein [Bacillus velezensis]MCR6606174.1 zf-HC2 domain-containing protein [Bacillus velezensis]